MEKAIKKVLSAYISRNDTCYINNFEYITKIDEGRYKVGTFEIDKNENEFKGTYYITLSNHGMQIEEIM